MNLYETVKGRVTPQMAAERYDLPVNRSGMACCPFHNDRTPSMKLYRTYRSVQKSILPYRAVHRQPILTASKSMLEKTAKNYAAERTQYTKGWFISQ